MKEQKRSHLTSILALLFVGFGAYLLFLFVNDQGSLGNGSGYKFKQDLHSQQKVNDHLISTAAKMALDKERAELMVRQVQNESQYGEKQNEYVNQEGLDISSESYGEQVHQIVRNKGDSPFEPSMDPNEMIQAKIFDEEKSAQYSEEYRRKYAEKFIENARKGGWEVFLDEDYRVIKVKPVKVPKQRIDIFNKSDFAE